MSSGSADDQGLPSTLVGTSNRIPGSNLTAVGVDAVFTDPADQRLGTPNKVILAQFIKDPASSKILAFSKVGVLNIKKIKRSNAPILPECHFC